MQKNFFFLGAALLVAGLVAGCANTENKLGRGVSNACEPIRLGEMRRSMEQTMVYDTANSSYATGFARGMGKTFARFGVGLYEIVTCPFPPYDPVCTNYLTPQPGYPDSYHPGLADSTTFATDTSIGFSGGEVAPFIPGSRFRVYDSP